VPRSATPPPLCQSDRIAALALMAGVVLLAFPAGTLLATAAGFAIGQPVSALALASGATAGVAVALAARRRVGARGAAMALAACTAVVLATLLIAPLRYDTSWDGQSYHQQAVIALARGWNPVAAPLAPSEFTAAEWVNAMAKGVWVVEASLYRLTHEIEAAKAIHLILLAAALLCALGALLSVPRLGKATAVACAALAALDPVALTQASTFYLDGCVASSMTALVACAYLAVERRDRLAVAGMVAATVLLANAKLTGIPYAVVVWAVACVAALARSGMRHALPLGVTGALALVASVLGPGWNPYATNAIRYGHPFHPAAGPRAIDFVAPSRPEAFATMNRLERLARATFSATSNHAADGARLKLPLTMVMAEGPPSSGFDTRLGGFGPFFSGALVLSALAVALATRRAAIASVVSAAGILLSVLATAEGWWARLAPQFWLVPVVLALAPLASPARRGARLLATLALVALAADLGVVGVNDFNRGGKTQRALRSQLAALASAGQTVHVRFQQFESAGVRLSEAGVRWRAVEKLPCASPVPLAGSFRVELCPPGDGFAGGALPHQQ
jgi:hypothetical protein